MTATLQYQYGLKESTISSDSSRLQIMVIGCGSIGRRHAENLARLGARVSLFDVDRALLGQICNDNGYTPIESLDLALEEGSCAAAVVCAPNHLHIPIARKVAEAGMHLFIEKPLSHSLEGVDALLDSVKRQDLIGMAGFNLRFEPGLRYIKSILNPDNVAFARIESGSHMPLWRAGIDYRKTYSANKSMGGGIILDDVHELDYACWFFGYPSTVSCNSGKFSNFDIDVEDTAEFTFRYPDKVVTIHSDYLQRRYSRNCKICFRDGCSLEWVYGSHVTEYREKGERTLAYGDTFTTNTMYLEEMRHFLDCIRTGMPSESSLENARDILEIALCARDNPGAP